MDTSVKVACVRAEPVVLDREATIDKLATLTTEAAGASAQPAVFPETFVPAYPSSAWAKALILHADLDPQFPRAERQRFEPAGHYHRPDVLAVSMTTLE